MYPISSVYDDFLKKRSREWLIKADVADVEYSNSVIVDFEIDNSLVLGEEFEIGTVILSKLTIKLRTRDVIPPNAKIIPYLGLSLDSMTWQDANYAWEDADWPWVGGATEWLPLGEFYVDSREQVGRIWVFTCYDKLVYADVPYVSGLVYPATMQAVWDEICTLLGFTYDSSVVIDPSYAIPIAPTGYTARQVMGYIASANSASVYVGKDGLIKFKRFSATDEPVYDLGPSDYVRAKQTNPIKTYTRIVITYDTEEGLTYEAGTGDENHTLYLENPFATQAIVDDLLATLNGFTYMPLTMDARGYPQLEAGDMIGFIRNESIPWKDADIAWQDMDLPWDGLVKYQSILLRNVYSFKGGLKMAIEAPSKSEQQSEFKVDGTLTAALDRLNKVAVKQGRNYFGVSITKEKGLFIERDDHASELTINSDILFDWRVGGVRKLYYDEVDDAIKFSGTIEASEILGGSVIGAYIATSQSFPRAELNVANNLVAAMSDATNYAALSSVGYGSVPSLTFVANNSLVAFINRVPISGTTLGTFDGEPLNFQPSGPLQIGGVSGVTGSFFVSSIPGGPADIQVNFTKGIRTN